MSTFLFSVGLMNCNFLFEKIVCKYFVGIDKQIDATNVSFVSWTSNQLDWELGLKKKTQKVSFDVDVNFVVSK